MLAVEREALVGERQLQDLQHLVEARARLVHVDPERLVLTASQPAADADVEVAVLAQDRLQHADLFGQLQRLPPRQHAHHGADVDAVGPTGDVGEQLQRIRDEAVRREVMLHGPQRVEPELLGLEEDIEMVLPRLPVGHLRLADVELTALQRQEPIPIGEVLEHHSERQTHASPEVRRTPVSAGLAH